MNLFHRHDHDRAEALSDIGTMVSASSGITGGRLRGRVFGLTGRESEHEVVVLHSRYGDEIATNVTVSDADEEVEFTFAWSGLAVPEREKSALLTSVAENFPD